MVSVEAPMGSSFAYNDASSFVAGNRIGNRRAVNLDNASCNPLGNHTGIGLELSAMSSQTLGVCRFQ